MNPARGIVALAVAVVPVGAPGAQGLPEGLLELELESEVFANTRKVRVLLPPGYDRPGAEARRHPVFYFTDGGPAVLEQAWNVPGTARELWRRGELEEWVFVTIDNGGATSTTTNPSRDRASEYIPYPDPTWAEPEPRGERFPEFLFDEVMPLVARHVRVRPGRESVGLAGASYGGAAALYTALKHPDRIGLLLVESPAFQIGDGRLFDDVVLADDLPLAVYLGAGTKEGATPAIQANMVEGIRRFRRLFEEHEAAPRVHLELVDGARHWYDAWGARLPVALRFLAGTEPAPPDPSPAPPGR